MKFVRLLLLFALTGLLQPARADGIIEIRVSYKVIVSPFSGADPQYISDGDILQSIDAMNTLMEQYGRGYRLVLVDPITRVGGVHGYTRPNPSAFFYENVAMNPIERLNMEDDAIANQGAWAWNPSAINIYVNAGTSGPLCDNSLSPLVVIGDRDAYRSPLHMHLLGHFFGLCNSQGCDCHCCGNDGGQCSQPGSDGVGDTLPDLTCWNENDSAQFNFGTSYANLTAQQQERVDAALRNVMSFRGLGGDCGLGSAGRDMTEGQLDRWADAASTNRFGVCDGRTFFVQAGTGGIQTGRSNAPFDRVVEGVSSAQSGGDIVMIRAGSYPDPLRISTPVTLRTPSGQTARIGQ